MKLLPVVGSGRGRPFGQVAAFLVFQFVMLCWAGAVSAQTAVSISKAEWESGDRELRVEGRAAARATVTVLNAANAAMLRTTTADSEGKWRTRVSSPSPVPCRVRATSNGTSAERDVSGRPSNCGPVADAQAPTAPANLGAAAAGASQINLAWSASTDNVGVAAYRIERCSGASCTNFAEIATATATTFANTGLTANTAYRYRVRAADAASNLSVYSNIASATTGQVVGQPSVSVNDISVTEGATATFTISLSAASASPVTVLFSTSGVTAASPGDFTAVTNRSLTIPAGQTSVTTQVVTVNDTVGETTETFNVLLSNPSGATLGRSQGVGTIVDNDFTNAAQAHAAMTSYDGPQTCVRCHEDKARQMHGSVHYQQNGPTDFVTNITGLAGEGPAGKPSGVNAVIGINTYCGTHENSPRFTCANCHVGNGRYPKTPAEFDQLGVGSQAQLDELANIDCLTCHQQAYKRFPDWTSTGLGFSDLILANVTMDANGNLVASIGSTVVRSGLSGIPNVDSATRDFMFRPSGAAGSLIPLPSNAPVAPMTMTTEQAAQTVHATTRQSCLNCHAGAAGANGAKRGDLSTANIASTDLTLDRHMATTGSNLTCSSCHNVPDPADPTKTLHRVKGRGLDLRANDHATRLTCDSAGCHNAATVHNAVSNAARLTRHTNRVACQTCHIPRYGKAVATEIARDWQAPHVTQTACNGRGGWLPNEIKSSTATPPVPVTPSYQWFDGNSQVYYLTESLTGTPTKPLTAAMATALNMPANTPAYVMGRPAPNSGASAPATGAPVPKIYPMKEHWGKLARDTATDTLIPHSTFEFFRTGSFCRAVAMGLGQNPDVACGTGQNTGVPTGAQVVPVHTYQTINHGVEPQASALGYNNGCGACHSVNGMTGGPARMDLKGQFGYRVRTTIGWTVNASGTSTCSNSCHSSKSASFVSFHERSQHVQRGCNSCHDQVVGR